MLVFKPRKSEFWIRVRRESAEAYKRIGTKPPKRLRWYVDLMRGSEAVNKGECLASRLTEQDAKEAAIKILIALRKVYISIES